MDETEESSSGTMTSAHSLQYPDAEEQIIQETGDEIDNFPDDIEISHLMEQKLDFGFQETHENKVLRETMEKLVSEVVVTSEQVTTPGSPEDEVVVLAPNHPMLSRFHKSVNEHLLKQKSQILNDIGSLTFKSKRLRKNADDNAEILYNLQQKFSKQHTQIDLQKDNLANDSELRQELEIKVQNLCEKHRMELELVQEAQTTEERLWRRLNENQEKESSAEKKKHKEDSKLAVAHRENEKAQIEKKLIAEEKKNQDEMLFRMTCEITELESRQSQLTTQLEVKQMECTRLKQASTSAAKDLEAQMTEHQRLLQAWQRLLVNAQTRENTFAKLQAQKMSAESEKRTLNAEVEGYKRESAQHMERNEHLTLCEKRLLRDKVFLTKQLINAKEEVEREHLELNRMNDMLKMTQRDLKRAEQTLCENIDRRKIFEKSIALLTSNQLNLENKILEAINEHASTDKAVYHAIKLVKQLSKEMDELETQIAQKEVGVAAVRLETQKQRFQNVCSRELAVQHGAEVTTAQVQLEGASQELRQAQLELSVKQGTVDHLNVTIKKIIDKNGGQEITAMEAKIKEMEGAYRELACEVEALQKQVLRKEISLLEQNKSREHTRKSSEDLQISVEHFLQKTLWQRAHIEKFEMRDTDLRQRTEEELYMLSTVNQEHAKLYQIRKQLEQENCFAFKDMVAAKKDEEQEYQEMALHLDKLGVEKQDLYNNLAELQRQQVDLEGKVKMATETKQAIDRERSSEGEITALRSEIHRMEVRLVQLKRTQERLTQDLEQCVVRRDSMVDSARARVTRPSGPSMTHLKSVRKLGNLKHANKQLLVKVEQFCANNAMFKKLEEKIKELEEDLNNKNHEILNLKGPWVANQAKLDKLIRKKKQNLEQLVHEQRRSRGLAESKEGRYKPYCRSESSLTSENQKQRMTLTNIDSIMDSLRADFPLLSPQLTSVLVLLKSVKVVYNAEPKEGTPEPTVTAALPKDGTTAQIQN